jgi:hypothetical protein
VVVANWRLVHSQPATVIVASCATLAVAARRLEPV